MSESIPRFYYLDRVRVMQVDSMPKDMQNRKGVVLEVTEHSCRVAMSDTGFIYDISKSVLMRLP